MLIGIDSNPCSLSLRNRSTLCSTTKCHQNKSDLKNVFVQKKFFNIYSFNPNHAYWNQRRLFSGNLPAMFQKLAVAKIKSIEVDRAQGPHSRVVNACVNNAGERGCEPLHCPIILLNRFFACK